MKRKWIFMVLAGLIICLVFSTSRGDDKFYYGAFYRTYTGIPDTDLAYMRNNLKFNILSTQRVDPSNIGSWVNNSLRAIVENWEEAPHQWAEKSHYTLWEAEGWEGSYFNLVYNGGEVVNDPSASGGKARVFTGPATPRLIQWGPTYSQERM